MYTQRGFYIKENRNLLLKNTIHNPWISLEFYPAWISWRMGDRPARLSGYVANLGVSRRINHIYGRRLLVGYHRTLHEVGDGSKITSIWCRLWD